MDINIHGKTGNVQQTHVGCIVNCNGNWK